MPERNSFFLPPRISPFIVSIFQPWNKLIFSRDITWIIDDESLSRWREIPKDAGLFLACKHAYHRDHYFIYELAARVRVRPYYVTIPEVFRDNGPFSAWFATRFGALPVERGGVNIQATRFIVDSLSKGGPPFAIFPEGELFYQNDLMRPVKPGIAFFALEGAKARAKAGKPGSMYILPMGVKYAYPGDASNLLEKKLSFLERKLSGEARRKGEILPRIRSLMEELLRKATSELSAAPAGKSIEEKFWNLSRILVEASEKEENAKPISGDLPDRARHFLEKSRGNPPRYRKAFWAMHSLAFFPGYLEQPTQERQMETLLKMERLITGNDTPYLPGHKLLYGKILEPISVDDYLPQYLERSGKKEAMQALSEKLQQKIQEAVDFCIARMKERVGSLSRS